MKLFSNVSPLKPGRSVFNLSHSRLFNCFHGQLIPVMQEEVVPGDKFQIGNEVVVRLMPMIAPILHEINIFVHYFFVPYRLLWPEPNGWESFVTGGPQGTLTPTLPKWTPTNTAKFSLWDYFGFPIGINPAGALPVSFPRDAYNAIYNEYYRDQTLIPEVSLDNESVLKRAWEKDYFTSALPWQQRGTAPALPFSGGTVYGDEILEGGSSAGNIGVQSAAVVDKFFINPENANMRANFLGALNNNTIAAATFNISDLRLAIQVQKFLERCARTGARYIEFLKAHFSVSPTDARLQRPEFIGGSKNGVVVSEVLQTSATGDYADTPQGTLAGHGITAGAQRISSYRFPEFGICMGLLSIMPRSQYSQGIDRQWLRNTRYDYYFPEFAHLSEQPVTRAEIYATAVQADNQTLFGYQGRYNELRSRMSRACGDMASGQSLNFWTLAREFATPPALNEDFINCDGSTASQTRVFATGISTPPYIVHIANKVKAIRPMPKEPAPGLLDHF